MYPLPSMDDIPDRLGEQKCLKHLIWQTDNGESQWSLKTVVRQRFYPMIVCMRLFVYQLGCSTRR